MKKIQYTPKWDGKHPAKRLRGWLRELREWRQVTTAPALRHGYLLKKSFQDDTWLKNAAERIPEEAVFTAECWELILREILAAMKPYLDVELDVLMEEFVFKCNRESKESMQSYIGRKANKYRDLCSAFGQTKIKCSHCNNCTTTNIDFPDPFKGMLWKRGAHLSDDHRKAIHQWDQGRGIRKH